VQNNLKKLFVVLTNSVFVFFLSRDLKPENILINYDVSGFLLVYFICHVLTLFRLTTMFRKLKLQFTEMSQSRMLGLVEQLVPFGTG
jgi:serine/threonine protein kinase